MYKKGNKKFLLYILLGGNNMQEVIESINIEDIIYEIRGVEVMLDSDLAGLYQVETKRINEAVYRNKEKFPELAKKWKLYTINI